MRGNVIIAMWEVQTECYSRLEEVLSGGIRESFREVSFDLDFEGWVEFKQRFEWWSFTPERSVGCKTSEVGKHLNDPQKGCVVLSGSKLDKLN